MNMNIAFVCIPIIDAVSADVCVLLSEQFRHSTPEANFSGSGTVIRQVMAMFLTFFKLAH
jgi:hypothetical protein